MTSLVLRRPHPPPSASLWLTLSGIDESIPRPSLVEMARWRSVELAFHYRPASRGRPRYPSYSWLRIAMPCARGEGARCALHVSGAGALPDLLERRVDDLVSFADRIQIDGTCRVADVEAVCDRFPDKQIITRHKPKNLALVSEVHRTNHAVLVDEGGRGAFTRRTWHRPTTSKFVGFAGNLGPENLVARLERYANALGDGAWIDLEESLRIVDRFDVARARAIVDVFRHLDKHVDARARSPFRSDARSIPSLRLKSPDMKLLARLSQSSLDQPAGRDRADHRKPVPAHEVEAR